MTNENKMNFLWTCNGAVGKASEITAPEIDRTCPKCGSKMILIDGRGFINSGTHSFIAECPKCKEKEKFDDLKLWEKLWHKCVKDETEKRQQEETRLKDEYTKLIESKSKEFALNPFALRLFKDALMYNINIKEAVRTLSKSNISEYKEIKFSEIQSVKFSNNVMYFEFLNANYKGILNEVSKEKDETKEINSAIIDNPEEFTSQCFKIAYLAGGILKEDKRKKSYNLSITAKDDRNYCIDCETDNQKWFLNRYCSESLKICSKKIHAQGNIKEYLKDDISKKLHLMLYKIFKKKESAENAVILLKTKENKEQTIKFLETGETDIDKIYDKIIQVI